MNNLIYGGLSVPSGFIFDYIHLGSFSSLPQDNQVAIGRFILIEYCDTAFSQDERNHIEASGGNNLTTEEEKYYQCYLEDNYISKDRMVYQKIYENNNISYKEIALINSTVSNESIEDFKNFLNTIQSQIKNITTVMDFVGVSSTVPTEKGATVNNVNNYQKGDVVIDNDGIEYINIIGGNEPNAWEIIGDATKLATLEEKTQTCINALTWKSF